jgi:hypothetical protein
VAISGMIFASLYVASLVLARLAVPAHPTEAGAWLADLTLRNCVRVGLNLIPFTGIAFLWFMGLLRNRIGHFEDRFFAAVCLGSGLLSVDAAASQALLGTFGVEGSQAAQSDAYAVGRAMAYALVRRALVDTVPLRRRRHA